MLRLPKYKYAFFLSLLSLAILILSSSFFMSFNLDIEKYYWIESSGEQSIDKGSMVGSRDHATPLVKNSTATVAQLQAASLLQENVGKEEHQLVEKNHRHDSCYGRRIYMYNLPEEFNALILQHCQNKIAYWINFCPHFLNHGFGKAVPSDSSAEWADWYETDPYMLEVIFHSRMAVYPCLTEAAEDADAFFIPYYSGLDALHYLYGEKKGKRAEHGVKLVRWLMENEGAYRYWRRRGGHDHFIVMGRTAWDFTHAPLINTRNSVHNTKGEAWNLSLDEEQGGWGTSFASLPEMENVTSLFLERRPWRRLEQAIPYPTGFHPTSLQTIRAWQDKVRTAKRSFLLAFVGAPRPHESSSSELRRIRQAAIDQCAGNATACSLLDCCKINCMHTPVHIAKQLLGANFCLQPPGDTTTRRSTFDGLLSGCIPVFFTRDSAYNQYKWHFPPDQLHPSSYSVLVPETQMHSVLPLLSSFSAEHVARMHSVIVEHLIPRLIYNSPHLAASHPTLRDAFQLTLDGMLCRVATAKDRAHCI